MNKRYALPKLIHGRKCLQQYWTWDKIHQITPEWCYLLRELVKSDPDCPNIITADSTYQYCKSPQTDQDSRKKMTNMHKHTTLVKIHIFAALCGVPIAAHYHYGDGYHA